MFKYVKYVPFTDEYTTHEFSEKDEKCKVHRFDVPYVSVECESEADFAELMAYQNVMIEAVEITQTEFADLVQYSAQVKRMYDVANEQYVNECKAITSKYTPEEISTWNTQVEEAKEVKSGKTTGVPYMAALAADDGITLTQAADKILSLRDATAAYTSNALANKWVKVKALKAEIGL